MQLSKIEFLAMNNPLRRLIQKRLEFVIFKQSLRKHSIDLAGKVILDAGCGSGYSTKLIIEEFMPSQIAAFDFMPEQINLAKKQDLKANFFLGNITKIDLPSYAFDAVFVFGVLHHVTGWKKALEEIARVLKPGGVLLVEELNKSAVCFFHSLGFTHPNEARFEWVEFVDGLKSAGFTVLEERKIVLGCFKSFLCLKK